MTRTYLLRSAQAGGGPCPGLPVRGGSAALSHRTVPPSSDAHAPVSKHIAFPPQPSVLTCSRAKPIAAAALCAPRRGQRRPCPLQSPASARYAPSEFQVPSPQRCCMFAACLQQRSGLCRVHDSCQLTFLSLAGPMQGKFASRKLQEDSHIRRSSRYSIFRLSLPIPPPHPLLSTIMFLLGSGW